MIIERKEQTIIPNTKDGVILADRFEKMLKQHDLSVEREETTTAITFKLVYSFECGSADD